VCLHCIEKRLGVSIPAPGGTLSLDPW